MKIGLYFGTFNPIHIGHLIVANHLVENSDLDQVWFVVTPHNPLKEKKTLLDDYQRLHMVNLAIENFPKLKASDVEFKLPQPNYTVNTLAHIQEKFPKYSFALIMGEDNLNTLHKWKNYNYILNHHSVYVFPRINTEIGNPEILNHQNIHKIDAPIIELSATFIRNSIKEKKNIIPMLPQKVWEYIEHNNFYRK